MGSPPTHTVDAALRKGPWPRNERAKLNYETVEKLGSERLMENVHMQGFRNSEE
jgi:hypothetical protein